MQSMQLTDWLVVIFVVAIVVVLVDGVRRKLTERRNRVVMKLDKNIPQDLDPEELPNSELPNGGARALVRDDQAVPSLHTLKSRRKPLFKSSRFAASESTTRAVPVLLDTVDVEEDRIEHTNVFVDPHASEAFEPDDFASADSGVEIGVESGVERAAHDEAEEFIDGLDEEYEEDAMLAEPTVARKEPGYMETRYQGRDDDDDDDLEDDEDEFEDEDEEDDEDFDELDDAEEFEDEDEEEDDLDDDDDYDDEDEDDEDEDDFDDEDDEEEEDEDEEDDEDLDELGGLPEDDWGNEEEEGALVDDYENEPMPLQGAFDKAASQFDKVASQAANQLDKVASQAVNKLDKAATQAASRFNRPPQVDTPRIEPGFGNDVGDVEGFDDIAFTEDFSAAFDDDAVSPVRESVAPRPERSSAPSRPASTRRDQGDLFPQREAAQESRLMAALQKAVPRSQAAPEPVAAAPVPQEVIIINVMARGGQVFHGGDLLSVLQEQGMRLGDMSIFHRHADNHGSGPVMFSMANMVKPGTFDLATMESFDTPGVSFFVQMPNKLGNMACFEKMLATASAVRSAFDAELKDEHRSVFTRQTVEHCRQRVRDFELKLLSRK